MGVLNFIGVCQAEKLFRYVCNKEERLGELINIQKYSNSFTLYRPSLIATIVILGLPLDGAAIEGGLHKHQTEHCT